MPAPGAESPSPVPSPATAWWRSREDFLGSGAEPPPRTRGRGAESPQRPYGQDAAPVRGRLAQAALDEAGAESYSIHSPMEARGLSSGKASPKFRSPRAARAGRAAGSSPTPPPALRAPSLGDAHAVAGPNVAALAMAASPQPRFGIESPELPVVDLAVARAAASAIDASDVVSRLSRAQGPRYGAQPQDDSRSFGDGRPMSSQSLLRGMSPPRERDSPRRRSPLRASTSTVSSVAPARAPDEAAWQRQEMAKLRQEADALQRRNHALESQIQAAEASSSRLGAALHRPAEAGDRELRAEISELQEALREGSQRLAAARQEALQPASPAVLGQDVAELARQVQGARDARHVAEKRAEAAEARLRQAEAGAIDAAREAEDPDRPLGTELLSRIRERLKACRGEQISRRQSVGQLGSTTAQVERSLDHLRSDYGILADTRETLLRELSGDLEKLSAAGQYQRSAGQELAAARGRLQELTEAAQAEVDRLRQVQDVAESDFEVARARGGEVAVLAHLADEERADLARGLEGLRERHAVLARSSRAGQEDRQTQVQALRQQGARVGAEAAELRQDLSKALADQQALRATWEERLQTLQAGADLALREGREAAEQGSRQQAAAEEASERAELLAGHLEEETLRGDKLRHSIAAAFAAGRKVQQRARRAACSAPVQPASGGRRSRAGQENTRPAANLAHAAGRPASRKRLAQ